VLTFGNFSFEMHERQMREMSTLPRLGMNAQHYSTEIAQGEIRIASNISGIGLFSTLYLPFSRRARHTFSGVRGMSRI
jgi:hypothetical protein